MRRERIPQPGRTVEERRDIDNLAGKQGAEPVVLYNETAFWRSARSRASVDFPAAILPHMNISFTEGFMSRML